MGPGRQGYTHGATELTGRRSNQFVFELRPIICVNDPAETIEVADPSKKA